MMGKMEVRTPPGGRPRDGRHCDLCGCSQPAVRCDKCGCQIFCLSCDDMYHRHPKRRFHLRKAVDPIPPVPQARPVLPVKVAHLNAATPGDPSKMPLPPPRKKKSIFGGFRRASPSSDQSSPNLPKKEYSWTDRLGSIKKFMSNRPLPPLPAGEDNDGDSLPTTNGQSPTRGDLTFIHKRSDERPPQLPQRSPKSPDFPPISQERDNRFPNSSMQMSGQIRNGTMEPNANHMNQSHDFPINDENQWNNRFPNQNGPQAFGTLQRQNHKGFMPPGAPGYPGGMHQSSSATDLHNLQNIEGMPGAAPLPPHYPHYPVNPHMPPHYPYPMYPQYPNYPQYFGQSFANLSNPPTTDGDVSDQSESASSRHSSKKHPFRKRAKRSQSVMMDRMAYPGQFPYPGPFGPYPGYGPWGAPMPMETPPSPASSLRSLNRSGHTRRRKKMTSEDDDEEFSLSSSPLSRPKSSSSGHKDSPQRAPLARETSSEEESDDEMRNRRNKVNTIRRQSEPIRTSSSPAEETSKKASKLKKKRPSKQSDSVPQEFPQVTNERRPSNDSITDQPVPQQYSSSPPSVPAPSPTWECRHCTYLNPICNKICQVCCKSAVAMAESPVASNSRPSSAAADSPKPSFSSEKGRSSADKIQESEDDGGKKEKRDMEILNSALDEAEKEISRGLEELMKLKDDIDTNITKDTKNEGEDKPVYKSSGRMRTSILDKLNLNKPQTSKSTASTCTETQTGQSSWTGDRILEGRRPSNASSASETYNSPTAQSPELDRRIPASMQKRDSSCQTQQDNLAEYLESKKASEEAFLGRPINNFGFGYGDRMDMMQSPVPPSMYDRYFGGGMAGMMQRSHSRASLFSGRINDPMDFGGPGFGYGPAPMYRSISRGSLTGDYPDGRLSEFHNLRKPDFYLSMEELVERRRQDNMRAQGLELVRMIREAEQHGFTADDIQVALTHCGKQSPMEWLQDNWRNMLDSVVTLSTNYGNDKKENDIGVLSENEAREALRLHKGNIWAAVTECVEGRQRKYLELSARGKFSRKDIVDSLTSSEGDVEMAYAKLTKSTGKPFLMRIWGDGEGVQNQDGAQPMPENLADIPQRYQKDDIANSDILSDELWSEDEDVDWEEDEYDEERAEFEDLQTCHEDLNFGPQEMRTPESDKSDYIDAFALEDRNLSSPSDDIFFVIPEQKPEKKKGFLGKLAALRRDSKEQVDTMSNVGKNEISLQQSSQSKGDAVIQSSATSSEQVKGNGALSALKNTFTAIKDTVTGSSKSDKKLPCAQPEKRTIIVRGQMEHESLSNNSKDTVKLTSVKPLEDDLSKQKPEKESSEKLKDENKSSDIKKEVSKYIKDAEIKVSSEDQSLETVKTVKNNKEPENLANIRKDNLEREKIDDTKTLGDNQMSKSNQSNAKKNVSETSSSNQAESQNKPEKKKSQSLAERLKFAKQSHAAKSSVNSSGVQEEPSASVVTLSNREKETPNQEKVNISEERKKLATPLQNQISKEAASETKTKVQEIILENSGTTEIESSQTHNQTDVIKKKSSQNENRTVASTSTAKDIGFPPQNESNTTVINKTKPSPQEVLKKSDDSAKTKSKSQEQQKEGPSANKAEEVLSKEKFKPESSSANKAEEIVSKEKIIYSQNENPYVQPEALQQSKETASSSNSVKEQENRVNSQFKEAINESLKPKTKVSKSTHSDAKYTSDKTATNSNSEIPKLAEKLIQNVQPLKEISTSQVKHNVPNVNSIKSNEPFFDGIKEADELKTKVNKNQKQVSETTLKIEQKTSTEEPNKIDGRSAEKLSGSLSPQSENFLKSSMIEQQSKVENKQVPTSQDVLKIVEKASSVSPEIATEHGDERKKVGTINNASSEEITSHETLKNVENASNVSHERAPQDILKNVENANTSISLSEITTPHDILKNVENTNNVSPEITSQGTSKNVENANTSSSSSEIITIRETLQNTENTNNALPELTSQDTLKNVENTNNALTEITSQGTLKNVENTNNALPEITPQDTLKTAENANVPSAEKAATDKEFVSTITKSAESLNTNQAINTVVENKVEDTTGVLEKTQGENNLLIQSENQQQTVADVSENSKPETITESFTENTINLPTTSFQKPAENETEGQQLQNSGKETDGNASVLDTEKPEPEKSAETQQLSDQRDSKPTVDRDLKESTATTGDSKSDHTQEPVNSETTVQKNETEENSGLNVEVNSQIEKENSSEIKTFDQGNAIQDENSLKESSSAINDSVKEFSEQINDLKSNKSIETTSEIPQNTSESSNGNKSISLVATPHEKVYSRIFPKEGAKSGKLISEKIERLRRSFSKEENDIKLHFKDKSFLKNEKTEPSSSTSQKDVKTSLGASSSAPQNSQKESVEDQRTLNDKALSEQKITNEVEIEKPNSVGVPDAKLQLNESEQLRSSQDLNLPSSDHKNEASGSQNASNILSEFIQNTELSNIAPTSGGNIISSTSKDSLNIAETSVASMTEQSPTSPKEATEKATIDANLPGTSQNEDSQEITNSNQIVGAKADAINTASSSTNDTDTSLSTVSEIKTDSPSETQQTSADIKTKEVAEAATSSTLPNQSEHSNIQGSVTDVPSSSSNQTPSPASIEQALQNISERIPESRNSTSDNNESDDTDIQYSDDESRQSSITPPNPIDTLRSRFEGLAGGTSVRGTVRPQSPFRRMSLNSRKQVIALEKIRDIKADKPWYQQKTEPLQVKTYPKRTIKQQLEMERKVRKMVADRIVATYRKAEIVVQLMDLNFEQEEAIQAANECSTLEQAISYLQQECQLCTGYFPVSQIVSMTHCQHRACPECIRAYFTVQIRDRTILDLLCPFCNQPDIGDEDVAQDYFNHLDIMLKKLVDVEIHELFQRKLRDRVLMKDPNFRWCSQCSSGFISMPNLTRLICPDCNAVTCASCRRLWDREHQGISCEAFAALKDASDPEAHAAGLAKMLTEDGIDCPSCHFKYALAKGGCMHFRCIQCQHDFCSGCSRPFKMGQKCGVSEFCAKLGLHAHHPRNCLFYLRDKEPEDLQKLLDMNDVMYNKDTPESVELKDACQVMEQKETSDGMVDDYCGKEVQDGYAGLCRVHYVEYLGQLVNKHKVDPIQIFDNDDLELVLRRANIRLPPKRYRESDIQYRNKLVNLIQEDLPLDRMEGS